MSPGTSSDRRRMQRVHLSPPLNGKIRAQRVHIMDVSLRGVRIAHQSAIGRIGDSVVIAFEWNDRNVEIECEIRRTELQRIGRASYSHTLYHSGLAVKAVSDKSLAILREVVEDQVVRVIREQKENAKLTPRASDEEELSADFVCHELVRGRWQSTRTNDASQPADGFTTRAGQPESEIHALQEAFAAGDLTVREDIRRIAGEGLLLSDRRQPPGHAHRR